jgi:steroid delta-isomerase-like uncharacterized protein
VDPLAVAQGYFDAWNARDPRAIASTFAPGGTYTDPNVPGGVDPEGTAAYAGGLFASFPDLRFELQSTGLTPDGLVAAQWLMLGMNTEPFQGLPPTGRAISLPGADFIRVSDAGIESVEGYFNSGTLVEQLGLDVIVQPRSVGPFTFGVSTHVAGKDTKPGAVSMTVLEARSEEEQQRVRELTRRVAQDMLAMPGFIGWLGVVVGSRMYTVTAWEHVDSVLDLRGSAAHREAMETFFGPDFAAGGQTGVWAPERLNGLWVRCRACEEMVRADQGEQCRCGAELPPSPRWW